MAYTSKTIFYTIFEEEKSAEEWGADPRIQLILQKLKNRSASSEDYKVMETVCSQVNTVINREPIGKTFGCIKVLNLFPDFIPNKRGKRDTKIIGQCINKSCNNIFSVNMGSVVSGNTRSCGCLNHIQGSLSYRWTGYGEISGHALAILKNRAASKKLAFDLTARKLWNLYIKQNKKCALSGLQLSFHTKSSSFDGNASLDRIDSNKGYTINNVQWVHKKINIMKNNLSESDFLYFIECIYNYQISK